MCGIFGILGGNARVDDALYFMRRRGPDHAGVWEDQANQVTLAHVRLSIIDTSSAGHQPMVSPDGRVVMVFNGEIYNFRELRKELAALGESFQGHSDSEVLLLLFQRFGPACFARLNGIFAVAFWERNTRRLWLARDQLGVKPLYVHVQGDRVAFCSELKVLLRTGLCAATPDPQAVLTHLGYLWSPGERTIVSGVSKVLPGQAVCFSHGAVASSEKTFYSDITFAQADASLPVDDIARRVAQSVHMAVRRQMVSDVPLGAFLSGGLDSSAVVAFAAREYAGPGKLQCFTIQVNAGSTKDEGFAEDLPYARAVAKHLGVDLHLVTVGDEMMSRLPEMIYLLDEPTPDPAALNTLFISELARQHGIKVLLSGAGGDDIFTGYRRHFALQQERWWSWLPTPMRGAIAALSRRIPTQHALGRRISKAFQYAELDSKRRLSSYFLWTDPQRALRLLAPRLRDSLSAERLFEPMLQTLARVPADTAALNQMLYMECKHFLADHNLNYTDKMGMAAGIEVRVPLLDADLVALAGSLPVHMKQRGATGKWIFKRAMEPYLPRDVIYRSKTGFGVPLRGWLRGPLREMVDDVLSKRSLDGRGIFDAAAVRNLREDDRAGLVDGTYTIFSILCIELWCRQFIDGAYALDVAGPVSQHGH